MTRLEEFRWEFVATTVFFMVACIVSSLTGMPALAGLIWGGSLAFTALAFGRFGAGHVNPAVTVGMWAAGRTSTPTMVTFWMAQCFGSITGLMIAGFLVTQAFGRDFASQFIVQPKAGVSNWAAFADEAFAACFLTVCVVVATVKLGGKGWADWLIIGLALGFFVWVIGRYSGGAANPVRAFAPWAIVQPESGLPSSLALYLVGPMLGGLVAGLILRPPGSSPPGA